MVEKFLSFGVNRGAVGGFTVSKDWWSRGFLKCQNIAGSNPFVTNPERGALRALLS